MAHRSVRVGEDGRDHGQPRRFQWLVLANFAEVRHNVVHRDRGLGDDEIRAFIAARERDTRVGIPDEVACTAWLISSSWNGPATAEKVPRTMDRPRKRLKGPPVRSSSSGVPEWVPETAGRSLARTIGR